MISHCDSGRCGIVGVRGKGEHRASVCRGVSDRVVCQNIVFS